MVLVVYKSLPISFVRSGLSPDLGDAAFSSTPAPLQRGQELRPVVNHWAQISKCQSTAKDIYLRYQCIHDGKRGHIYSAFGRLQEAHIRKDTPSTVPLA